MRRKRLGRGALLLGVFFSACNPDAATCREAYASDRVAYEECLARYKEIRKEVGRLERSIEARHSPFKRWLYEWQDALTPNIPKEGMGVFGYLGIIFGAWALLMIMGGAVGTMGGAVGIIFAAAGIAVIFFDMSAFGIHTLWGRLALGAALIIIGWLSWAISAREET